MKINNIHLILQHLLSKLVYWCWFLSRQEIKSLLYNYSLPRIFILRREASWKKKHKSGKVLLWNYYPKLQPDLINLMSDNSKCCIII
jgi:hypothetical protein